MGKEERANIATQNSLMQKQSNNADQVLGIAKPLLQQSSDLIQTPIKYFQTLASGDRNAMSSLLGPEIGNINQGYQNAQNQTLSFGPRGGGRNSQLQNLGQQQQGDISRLFQTARPAAMQALTGISGQIGSQGSGLFGQGSQIYQGNIQDLGQQNQQYAQSRQQVMSMIGQLGGAAGGALFGHFFPPG